MDVGFIEANYATLVNHNFLDEAKPLMVKIEDYHSEQGAIRIIAKIKVTYITVIEYQSKADLGFNVPHIGPEEGIQLLSDYREVQTAVPETHFNFNNPRLLTMWQGGLQYSTKNKTTTIGDTSGINPSPPVSTREKTVSEQITEYLTARDIIPDETDETAMTTTWRTSLHTSTPKSTPQINRYKRKLTNPQESKAKRYKIVDGAIEHQSQIGKPILRVKLTPNEDGTQWKMTTTLAKDSVVDFVPEEGAASTQDKTLRHTDSRYTEEWNADESL